MGYVHDTAMSQFIPPTAMICITGTWTEAAGQVAGTVVKHCAATDESTDVYIPILIPSNTVANKGALLKSIQIDYEILVAACDTVTADILKITRGADTAVHVVDDTVAFSYDTGHDTAGERLTLAQHKMTSPSPHHIGSRKTKSYRCSLPLTPPPPVSTTSSAHAQTIRSAYSHNLGFSGNTLEA